MNLGENLAIAFEDTDGNGFTVSPTSSFSFDATCSKERFIDFNPTGEWRLLLTEFSQTDSYDFEKSVNRIAIQSLFGLSNWLCAGADVVTSFWPLAWWIVCGRLVLCLIAARLAYAAAVKPGGSAT